MAEFVNLSPVTTTLAGDPDALPSGPVGQNGRKRRYKGSSSSDEQNPPVKPDRFVEEDLRVGGPDLCPLPARTRSVPEILESHNVDYESFDIFGRRSEKQSEREYVPTILVWAKRQSLDNSWLAASRNIFDYIKPKLGGMDVAVEIVDKRALSRQFSPALPTDAVSAVWAEVIQTIIEEVDFTDINAVGRSRIGWSTDRSKNPPYIHVDVSKKADHD
jgi:hypothetical protein